MPDSVPVVKGESLEERRGRQSPTRNSEVFIGENSNSGTAWGKSPLGRVPQVIGVEGKTAKPGTKSEGLRGFEKKPNVIPVVVYLYFTKQESRGWGCLSGVKGNAAKRGLVLGV